MKAILLDGSRANDNSGERVRAALMAQIQTQGWYVEHIVLSEKKDRQLRRRFLLLDPHPRHVQCQRR